MRRQGRDEIGGQRPNEAKPASVFLPKGDLSFLLGLLRQDNEAAWSILGEGANADCEYDRNEEQENSRHSDKKSEACPTSFSN